ncbi:MAG: hypothetical protein RL653_2129 [Pseudomonadota bacterium]|jgi:mono/diheme cytochrome c family protein
MIHRCSLAALAALSLGACLGGPPPSTALVERRAAYAGEDPGLQDFLLGDFQGLSREALDTFGVPWKVSCTALLLFKNPGAVPFDEEGAVQLLQRYGLYRPARIANWPDPTPAPTLRRPLGTVTGMLVPAPGLRVEVSNNGCATCHAARGYDAEGNPTDEAWLGLSSTSVNYEAWAQDAFGALEQLSRLPDDEVVKEVRRAFPRLDGDEERALRWVVLPKLKERLRARAGTGRFVDFSGGLPGLTNGVATLKMLMGQPEPAGTPPALVSVPMLSGRELRTSHLWDGVYAPPGRPRTAAMTAADVTPAHLDAMGAIPAVFTTGTLGIPPHMGAANVERTRRVFRASLRLQSPPFPGALDEGLLARGEGLFNTGCAGCHGTYDRATRPARLVRYPNQVTPQAEMGTDPMRWERVDATANAAFGASAFGRFVDARPTGGYVAPILTGTWATAPYLHNGSVPTLEALVNPEKRPRRFLLGGHKLDLRAVGIAAVPGDATRYPDGYVPWSVPVVYDTDLPGQGNDGHEDPFADLDEADKRAIIEYLKAL